MPRQTNETKPSWTIMKCLILSNASSLEVDRITVWLWLLPLVGWELGNKDAPFPPCPSEQKLDGWFCFVLLPPGLQSRHCCTFLHSLILSFWETHWLSVEEMKSHDKKKKSENSLLTIKAPEGRRQNKYIVKTPLWYVLGLSRKSK